MARADLIVQLAQSGARGDRAMLQKVVEAIAMEERRNQHTVLADKLASVLHDTVSEKNSGYNASPTFVSDQRSSNFVQEMLPKRKFEDLILSPDILSLCRELVQEQHRVDLLRSYNLEPRNRVLLVGPPGNGKTSLAEAIAESLMVPLLVVRYDSIVGSYLGETAIRLRRLFEYAATRRCVLFFDEFETLGKERGDTHETGEIKRVVSSLLLQVDALPSHVVVVCATNHPELLDRAVWRRFQVRLELSGPTREQIANWFEAFGRKSKVNFGVAPSTLAKRLLGLSFAEVEEFGLSVVRQYVLSQPNSSLKEVLSKTMRQWEMRAYKLKRKAK